MKGHNVTILPDDVRFIRSLEKQINSRMFGLEGIVRCLLAALTTGGHALLEGNPGLGKTALVKTIAGTMRLPEEKVGRIQFTPDLMPADITGTLMPKMDDATRLEFQKGPIFKWLLLADEINRATPKTQAAMLEAMAEKQVTVFGVRRSLVDQIKISDLSGSDKAVYPPFMVMATQNPIDQEGTYNLPEAQSDRFMFKLRMPFPDSNTMRLIVEQELRLGSVRSELEQTQNVVQGTQPEAPVSLLHIDRLNQGIRDAEPNELVSEHIRNMVLAGDLNAIDNLNLAAGKARELKQFCQDFILYRLGPRAAFAMELGARAYTVIALLNDSATDEVADHMPHALGQISIPSVRHRIKLKRSWEGLPSIEGDDPNLDRDRKQDQVLANFVKLCAPDASDYQSVIETSLETFLKKPF